MKHWIPVFLCLLLPMAASAQAATDRLVLTVDWGDGVLSRGEMRVSGLPAVMRTRDKTHRRARLRQGGMKSDTAPGERVNRPEFGSGKKKSRPTAARGRPKPMVLTKSVGISSPYLRRVHLTRRVLPRVVLKTRDKSNQLQTIFLTNVMIISYSTRKGKGGGDVAMEEITLSCEGVHLG